MPLRIRHRFVNDGREQVRVHGEGLGKVGVHLGGGLEGVLEKIVQGGRGTKDV